MKILAESLSRPRLSVAMIVRDEQDVLAESIESVHKIADEIVVLDTGSTDRTPELAAQLVRDGPAHALGKRLLSSTEPLSEVCPRKLGALARCRRTYSSAARG